MRSQITLLVLFITAFGWVSCTDPDNQKEDSHSIKINMNVEKIDYGNAICAFTGETIKTTRYGGRIELKDGTIFDFMSVECTAAFFLNYENKNDIAQIKITDFAHGVQLLPVDQLRYLRSPLRPSPNGLFLTAVDASNQKMIEYIHDAYPGEYLSWEQVLQVVQDEMDLEAHKANSTIKKNRAE